MTMITRESLLVAARRYLRPGITREQAVLLGYAELEGNPLDPHGFDDAATLLRAERLFLDGVNANTALSTARSELPTWNHGALE